MKQARFLHIDILRAVSIVGVIAIHTLSYNLADHTLTVIWNYLHFVVVGFVFCSGYVLAASPKSVFPSPMAALAWYKHRLFRLIVPFYWYLLAHFAFFLLLPQYFSGLGLQRDWRFALQSVFFVGGIDLNWLPLLFIELAVLFPIFMVLLRKPIILAGYTVLAVAITIYGTIRPFPYAVYRWEMWLPWSLVLLAAILVAKWELRDPETAHVRFRYAYGMSMAAVLFGVLYHFRQVFHFSTRLIDHKYPPDFYYLLYATALSSAVLLAGTSFIWRMRPLQWLITFISKQSYALFFVSYIVLDFDIWLSKQVFVLHWVQWQFMFVLGTSLAICWCLQYGTDGLQWGKQQIRMRFTTPNAAVE